MKSTGFSPYIHPDKTNPGLQPPRECTSDRKPRAPWNRARLHPCRMRWREAAVSTPAQNPPNHFQLQREGYRPHHEGYGLHHEGTGFTMKGTGFSPYIHPDKTNPGLQPPRECTSDRNPRTPWNRARLHPCRMRWRQAAVSTPAQNPPNHP
jgi:hypothetical protein